MGSIRMFLALILVPVCLWAHPDNIGYSGAPTRLSCAMSCHGSEGGSLSIQGFPATYTPGALYTMTIVRVIGEDISNFNASVRVGTSATNAGLLGQGENTSIYDTVGETNGVHFTVPNQTSGTFVWTAPGAGTGTVRLWASAHQGTTAGGANWDMVYISQEGQFPPGVASDPHPSDGSVNVPPDVILTWRPDPAASSHDLYLDTATPPGLEGNVAQSLYDPPANLQAGAVYYWRVDERNSIGVTAGPIWSFTVMSAPGQATAPTRPTAA